MLNDKTLWNNSRATVIFCRTTLVPNINIDEKASVSRSWKCALNLAGFHFQLLQWVTRIWKWLRSFRLGNPLASAKNSFRPQNKKNKKRCENRLCWTLKGKSKTFEFLKEDDCPKSLTILFFPKVKTKNGEEHQIFFIMVKNKFFTCERAKQRLQKNEINNFFALDRNVSASKNFHQTEKTGQFSFTEVIGLIST